jgi:hypothetical protein
MLVRGWFSAVLSNTLLLVQVISAEAFKDFGGVYRETKFKNGEGALRYDTHKDAPEADPKTFRFYSQNTSRMGPA